MPDMKANAHLHRRRSDAIVRSTFGRDSYKGIIDSAADGIVIFRCHDARIVDANESFARLLGYPVKKLKALTWWDVFSEPHSWWQTEEYPLLGDKRVGEGNESEAQGLFEQEYIRHDGTKLRATVSYSKVFDINGDSVRCAIVRTKRTNLDREDSAQSDDSRYLSILESATDAIISIDDQCKILQFNSAAEKIFRCKAIDALGESIENFIPEEQRKTHRNHVMDFAGSGQTARPMGRLPELRGLRSDGAVFPIEVSISQVDSTTGKVFTAIIRDLTEQKAIESQLRQAQKMKAVGQLTGGLAHDFNNLLAVITGNLTLALSKERKPERQLELIKRALKAGNRGAELVQRLMAFSRQQNLSPDVADVGTLADGIKSLIERTLGENIKVRLSVHPDLWTCEIDTAQFENALLNLAINARDAMPEGGTLTISVQNSRVTQPASLEDGVSKVCVVSAGRDGDTDFEELNRRISASMDQGDYVLCCVSDTGIGMSDDVLEKAFEPFFTTKDIGQGNGLGLSMVYGFVKQSGGYVFLDTEVGLGSSVYIFLPRSSGGLLTQRDELDFQEEPHGSGETILVIEDDPDVRYTGIQMLLDLNYRVIEASDGVEALRMLAETPDRFNMIITDVMLPGGVLGTEVAAQARRLRPNIPILYISGYSGDTVIDAKEHDSNIRLLKKPFATQQLAIQVRNALSLN